MDILWLFGVYLDYVEDKVINRGQAILVEDFVGHTKYNWKLANHEARCDTRGDSVRFKCKGIRDGHGSAKLGT